MIAISRTLRPAGPLVEPRSGAVEPRWPPAAAAAFVLASSLVLWAIILFVIRLVLG